MELLKYLVIMLVAGCVVAAPSDDKPEGETPEHAPEPDVPDEKTEDDKRLYGSVLSRGFKLGKKEAPPSDGLDRNDIKQDFKKWYYGSVLGHGFKAGKRHYDGEQDGQAMVEHKRDFDSIDQDINAVDLEGPVDDKRWFGDVFFGGYPGRRTRRDADDKRFIHYFGRGFVFPPRSGGIDNDPDGERYDIDDILPFMEGAEGKEYGEDGEDENDADIDTDKRYFWSDHGSRFDFGKRCDDGHESDNGDFQHYIDLDEDHPLEKRLFGSVLGRGYAFGKRGYQYAPARRPFGHVIGRGFSFGKRTNEDSFDKRDDGSDYDEDMDMDKRRGWLLGRGFKLGKRGSKRFGWILGRGLKFGKRSSDAGPVQERYFIDDFGNVDDIREQMPEKRLGRAFGRGYAFGKRGSDSDHVFDKRGFGYVLGHGFRFGKR